LAYASIIESSGYHGLKMRAHAALIDELKGDDVHCTIAQLHNCTIAQLHSRAFGRLLLPALAKHQCLPVKRLIRTGFLSNTIWLQRSRTKKREE